MKQRDFTELVKFYVDRPGYSKELLSYIKDHIEHAQGTTNLIIADVGAGTGKLPSNLYEIGCAGFAVEPNDAMRTDGEKCFVAIPEFRWQKGFAEKTELADNCADWLLMGSSFHWANVSLASAEFARVLKPGGLFTVIWNPRDIGSSELHTRMEDMNRETAPELKRVSSGSTVTTEIMEEKLGNYFEGIVFMEAKHEEIMTKERYMNIWRSVNDIRAQAGEERFQTILDNITEILKDMDEVIVPYKSRTWTARVKNRLNRNQRRQ